MNRNFDVSMNEGTGSLTGQLANGFQFPPYSFPSQEPQCLPFGDEALPLPFNSLTADQPQLLPTSEPSTLHSQTLTPFPSQAFSDFSHQSSPFPSPQPLTFPSSQPLTFPSPQPLTFPSSQPFTSPSSYIPSGPSNFPTPTTMHSGRGSIGESQCWGGQGYPAPVSMLLPMNPPTSVSATANPSCGSGGGGQDGAWGQVVWEPEPVPSGSWVPGSITQNNQAVLSPSLNQLATNSQQPYENKCTWYKLPPQQDPEKEKRRLRALREFNKRQQRKKEEQDLLNILATTTLENDNNRAEIMRTRQNIEWYSEQVQQTEMSLQQLLDEDLAQQNIHFMPGPSTRLDQ
ncbi:hypothetical protein Pmani_026516 [Petrolisthes manimaculis]|uniref:Uncharacterized protein n=1 Tax=Petrolisthes manimaculis TaxID=1843537 RepID=A0AAE1P3I2_9EUCA|nr:hypothetical protein Pmani_026516 [Petrolisthes manimaculis]